MSVRIGKNKNFHNFTLSKFRHIYYTAKYTKGQGGKKRYHKRRRGIKYRENIYKGDSMDNIEKIMSEICRKSHVENINQVKMPLFISMVDLQTGTVYIASSNEERTQLLDDTQYITDIPISTAVRGSCSFPVVFSPCKFENIQLIDGGTRENLPWKCLKDIGADEVIGICFETIHKKECCKNSFVRGMFAVKGSINDPRKQCYHLEINCKKESVAITIQNILKEKEIESKIIMKVKTIYYM